MPLVQLSWTFQQEPLALPIVHTAYWYFCLVNLRPQLTSCGVERNAVVTGHMRPQAVIQKRPQ